MLRYHRTVGALALGGWCLLSAGLAKPLDELIVALAVSYLATTVSLGTRSIDQQERE
jgi:hypothetical protein